MPVITYIARQLFTYPFIVKIWDKATAQEAKAFFTQRPALTTKIASKTQSS